MGAGKEYRITGDAAALAKLSRPPVSTSSGGGAAAVVSEAADSLAGLSVTSPAKRPPSSGACATGAGGEARDSIRSFRAFDFDPVVAY